jgi:hypothetical protein
MRENSSEAIAAWIEARAEDRGGVRGPHGERRDLLDLSAVLELQELLESVAIEIVDGEREIRFVHPASRGVHAKDGVAVGNVLDQNEGFHRM